MQTRRMLLSLPDGPLRVKAGRTRRVSFPGHRTTGYFPFSSYGAAGGSSVVTAATLNRDDVQTAFSQVAPDTVQINLPREEPK